MRVKVRGTCPVCGHVVDTEAPRDRVTWRGACPTDGCSGRVLARRVEQQDQGAAEKPAEKPAADPAPRTRRSSVPRVGHGDPAAGKAETRRAAGRGTGDGGSQRAAADVPPAARPGTPGDPDTGTSEPVGPGRGRARAAEPDARPVRPYGHLYSFD